MKKLALILLFAGLSPLCHAQSFDLSFPGGLTVAMYGASTYACPECGLDQGATFVRFNENLNQSWVSSCLNQRFYINASPAGKMAYQSLLLAQLTGKKITRILGNVPGTYSICTITWLQVE